MAAADQTHENANGRKLQAVVIGALLFAGLLFAPPPDGLTETGWRVAGVAVLMAVWWLSEAIPVPVTALLPILLLPLLDVLPIKKVAASYAHPLIFLFMGGFIIALALERWHLHRRIALKVLVLFGTRPAMLVAGFMLATAGLSMWISNTATTVMMIPIAMSVLALLHDDKVAHMDEKEDRHFRTALMLGIAYAASIGGVGTLIGTPPNALLAAYMADAHGRAIGFGQWMVFALPLVALMLPIAWWMLVSVVYPLGRAPIQGAAAVIAGELAGMGKMTTPERRVAFVFVTAALLWVLRAPLGSLLPDLALSDAGIAIGAALALFILPAGAASKTERLMTWEQALKLPWGVLILFGGGLALAAAIQSSGLAKWIGGALSGGENWPVLAAVGIVALLIVFLTEITSNTATTAVFLPVAASVAPPGLDPLLLTAAVALSASCAFMMPVATPPNAIVFGTGNVTIQQMARAGLMLNVIAVVLISLIITALAPLVFS
ncbi:MAG: DASS family sodium-coupled anion symporter [Rhodospirillaceae bacterium]|nr:DASS family sodium-coupled anion symporter [Rhodospirillaceae bacterium]